MDKAYRLEAQEVYKAEEDEHEVVEQMMDTMQPTNTSAKYSLTVWQVLAWAKSDASSTEASEQ